MRAVEVNTGVAGASLFQQDDVPVDQYLAQRQRRQQSEKIGGDGCLTRPASEYAASRKSWTMSTSCDGS